MAIRVIKHWTEEELKVIKNRNLTIQEVADQLNRTYPSVARKRYRLGQGENDELVKCFLCHKKYRSLIPHIINGHKMPLNEYQNQFPDSPLLGFETSEKLATYRGKKRPEHGAKVTAALKGRKANLSVAGRKALSEASRKRLLDPDVQSKMQEGLRKYNETHPGPWKGAFGPANPNWKGGTSFDPYSPEFTFALKLRVRKRDDYKCQLCGRSESENLQEFGKILSIHHVNYDKTDCRDSNLIALCSICHSITNGNRSYFMGILGGNQKDSGRVSQLRLPGFEFII